MIYPLIPENDPLLFKATIPFDFANPPIDPMELHENLKASVVQYNGLGLSANQVGLPWRVFIMGDPGTPETLTTFFNPKVVYKGGETSYSDEGCLSFPGLILKVKRHNEVRVRFQRPNGIVETQVLKGMTARIVQHEIDHLDGIVFKKRATAYHLNMGNKRRQK